MKMITRRFILISTILMTLLLVSGCNSGGSGGLSGLKNNEEPLNIEKDSLLEFEFYKNYAWDVGKYTFDETNQIGRWVMENKGVKVNFTWPGGGNPNDKLNIMVATDSLPEVIMVSRDQTWTNLISDDGLSDKIIPLDKYYEKYEGYRTNVDKDVVDFTRVNGSIYGMLNWPKQGDWKGFGTGIVLNNEIYQSLGSPKLDTLDDLYEYLKSVKETDPTIVPFQPGANEVTFGMVWTAFGEGRVPRETYGITLRPVDGMLKHIINDPKFPEFIAYLRKLYQEGLISQEYYIEMSEPVKDKLKRRKIAVYSAINSIDETDNVRSILEAADKENPYEAYPMPAAKGVSIESIVSGESSKVGWNVICLTNNAKMDNGKESLEKEEAIYEYLDWVFSNEGQRIMLCGPEGILWEGIDENDFPIFKEGKSMKLTPDEMKIVPLGQFMYPGNASFVDSLKMHLNAKKPVEERSWLFNQQVKFVNNLKEATEFTGIETIEDFNISQIYVRADDYWDGVMIKLVTENEDIDTMIDRFKTELYDSYEYHKYEEYATNIWKANRVKMGLD